jgi:hypothetical protein
MLERMANPVPPTMPVDQTIQLRNDLGCGPFPGLSGDAQPMLDMKNDFGSGHGDLETWKPEVLAAIDKCFVDNFMEDDQPVPCLFSPLPASAEDNYARFKTYCDAVDKVLIDNPKKAPKYAREYFAIYTIWHIHGWRFPVPIITASVVECLHKIASKVRVGMIEVSLACLSRSQHPLQF